MISRIRYTTLNHFFKFECHMNRYVLFLAFVFSCFSSYAQAPFDTATALRNNPGIFSLVVTMDDSTVYSRYFNGKGSTELFNNQSLTKSIEAVLICIAIDKGFIPSLYTGIANYFPLLKNDPDKRKTTITIADVMNQASGLWHENLAQLDAYLRLEDPSGYVLKQPLLSAPGSELHYNNAASHLLSVILSKATGLSTYDFARRYLLDPLDIRQSSWPKMKDGYYDGSGLMSIHLRTSDINKIGRLLLNEGRYKEQQIVSAKWTQMLLNPPKTYPAPWHLRNTAYGLCYYHKTYRGEKMVYGMGWGGQFLILLPGLHTVISVNQDVNDRTAIQQSDLFMDSILPMIFDWIIYRRNGSAIHPPNVVISDQD